MKKLVVIAILSSVILSCGTDSKNSFTIASAAPTVDEIKASNSDNKIESIGGDLVLVEEKADGSVVKFYKVTDSHGEEHTLVSVFEPLL